MNTSCTATAALSLLLAAACADDINPSGDRDGGRPDGGDPSARIVTEDNGDGSFTTRIDATSMIEWVRFDAATGEEAAPSTWDLGFQRFHLQLNGGVTGTAGVEIAVVPGVSFDDLTEAPAGGYLTDLADGDDDGDEPDYAFEQGDGWYAYDPDTHVLTPRDQLYVVRDSDGAHLKLAIESYYDDAGTGGFITFRWATLTAAASHRQLEVDASDESTWVHVDLGAGSVVEIADPANSDAWDLALRRAELATNSGTSGPGAGGAADPAVTTLDEVTTAAGVTFVVDALLPLPGPPGSGEYSGSPALADWYDYDPISHAVSPKAKAYVVRNASGGFARLAITAWADGAFTLSFDQAGDGEIDF